MNIIGIDPGPEESAVIFWDGLKIVSAEKLASGAVINSIDSKAPWGAVVACEHLECFGMAVGKEVFETAYWIGAIRQHCETQAIQFRRIYRSEEKMHLCHSMRATDSNIRQAIIDLFGGKDKAIGKKKTPGPFYGLSGDLWSALAVALTFAARQ